MNEKQKAKIIIKTLNKIYPKAPIPLKSKNTFTLLISVHCAESSTEIKSVKVFLLFRGTGALGYILFRVSMMILAFCFSFIKKS